jgi:hypothetical protein
MRHALSLAAAFLLAGGALLAQSSSPPAASASQAGAPSPASPALPQDRHEGLTVSVDPYTDSQRAKEKFGKSANPVPAGILPVDVFLKNETPHPIKIDLETAQLEVRLGDGNHQEIDWLTVGQVAYLIVHPGGAPSAPSARRFPVGLPTPGKDKKVSNLAAELRPFALDSDVVPPLGSMHGFLFFNMNHDFEAALKSSLYLPDATFLPDKKPLMFFEVPLASNTPSPPADSQH